MGTFNVTSSTLNNNYEYVNSEVKVSGSYQKDAQTDALQSVNGSVYALDQSGQQGAYIGNFNGYVRDGEVKYSISEMSRRDANKVWDAIDEIEAEITGSNAGEE